MTKQDFCQLGREVIETELEAIQNLLNRIDDQFTKACEYLLQCQGRIVVIGMGKSGHIGNKIAATLASTGSPAFFVHPAEANHGDIGMITRQDTVLVISNSGNTSEILTLLPIIKRLGVPLIALTGNPKSTLAKQANAHLNISVTQEACPLNLAPTASTTAALVMGDALAIALLKVKGITKEDFALSHPGGQLGRQLLLRIHDIMHTGEAIPNVKENTLLLQALLEMTQKSLGMTAITNNNEEVMGVFTDGDLRRTLDLNINIQQTTISDVMTKHCMTVKSDMLAAEALKLMESKKIGGLLVVDENNKLVGALNFQDLLRAGVM